MRDYEDRYCDDVCEHLSSKDVAGSGELDQPKPVRSFQTYRILMVKWTICKLLKFFCRKLECQTSGIGEVSCSVVEPTSGDSDVA